MTASKRNQESRPATPTPADAGLHVGAVVVHRDRLSGFGVHRHAGTIGAFVEPRPGWHRAIVAWQDESGAVEYEQFVDTDKLEPAPAGDASRAAPSPPPPAQLDMWSAA